MISNPFAVFTPEGLTADRVVAIFSTEMPGLGNIESAGHAFVIGTRGSGKSILFRYLEPDCQRLVTGKALSALPFLSLYVSFRETQAQITELARFEDRHGEVFFNEHLLVLAIGAQIVLRLLRNNDIATDEMSPLAQGLHTDLSQLLGGEKRNPSVNVGEALRTIAAQLQAAYRSAIQYIRKHGFMAETLAYTGELYGFDDLLLPLIDFLRSALRLEEGLPILLLLDDADSLTETQTRIINSWVARRLSSRCSLKIAAQITAYKTMVTVYNTRIEAPHDYQEINLSDATSRASEKAYRSRIAGIVQRRLNTVGIVKSVEEYFPEDNQQRIAIKREERRLIEEWDAGRGRGHRARDDAYRYARPNYIAKLGGNRKSRSTYSYSGFDQLVHISSGVTRFFLEAAADMYSKSVALASPKAEVIGEIEPRVQNEVVREHANRQMIVDLKDLERDVQRLKGNPQQAVQLSNLIKGLGSLFESALIDEGGATERKLFSFALSEEPKREIEEVLRLGVRYGYLFQGVIGRKEGIGRAPLFILSRRLAPLFNLDPMGFSAYKFLSNESVELLMNDPDAARRGLRRLRSRHDENQIVIDFQDGGSDA
ncbi:MAG: ORC-CDC6 family AAA ATPase [Paracoccus sp. (in: a-proteobacteria)]|uniref:ORC-CDC6 family AAA ATPase n=1 Tax=Paracoccus sp. TaxID=267 RepID=UPI00405A3ACC